jgi:hypothetical protein
MKNVFDQLDLFYIHPLRAAEGLKMEIALAGSLQSKAPPGYWKALMVQDGHGEWN